jgi:hypothetical protein
MGFKEESALSLSLRESNLDAIKNGKYYGNMNALLIGGDIHAKNM